MRAYGQPQARLVKGVRVAQWTDWMPLYKSLPAGTTELRRRESCAPAPADVAAVRRPGGSEGGHPADRVAGGSSGGRGQQPRTGRRGLPAAAAAQRVIRGDDSTSRMTPSGFSWGAALGIQSGAQRCSKGLGPAGKIVSRPRMFVVHLVVFLIP